MPDEWEAVSLPRMTKIPAALLTRQCTTVIRILMFEGETKKKTLSRQLKYNNYCRLTEFVQNALSISLIAI